MLAFALAVSANGWMLAYLAGAAIFEMVCRWMSPESLTLSW